jgi:peptide/nickel transport system permease protein
MTAGRLAHTLTTTLMTPLALALAAFAVVRALPGEPAAAALFLSGAVATPEAVAQLRAEHGLDAGLVHQFLTWVGGILSGDWGRSIRTGEPVLAGFLARLPVSLAIGGGGLAVGAALGYMLALVAAAGSRLAEGTTRALALVVEALPAFVAGVVILYVFGVELRWLKPFTGGPVERVLLPAIIVALYTLGTLARLVTLRLRDAMALPFFLTARAKGLSTFAAVRRHAGGFGLIALVAALKVEAAWVVGGTAVTEVLFGAPGVSAWLVESIGHRDYAVLQGYILVVAVWLLVVHAVADIALGRIDPRRP